MRERRKKENRQRAIEERKCFSCRRFGHITYHCRNIEEEGPAQVLSNKFEVLKDRVMQRGEGSGSEVGNVRKIILREERVKKRVEV